MKYAEQLWQQLLSNDVFIKCDWQSWQHRDNNRDSVLFVNDKLKKAIYICVKTDSYFEFGYFFDTIIDNENEIELLHISTNDVTVAQSRLETLIKNWLNGLLANGEE